MKYVKVLVVATSRETRGGITSVIKAHETGEQWKKYHCVWIQTHRDGSNFRKILYLFTAYILFLLFVPFCDIVHIHGTSGSSGKRKLPFIWLANKMGKKCIFHFHPSSEGALKSVENRKILKSIFDRSDMILALSPFWVNLIKETFPNENYNIQVQWNPCPKVCRNRSKKKKYILYAGTLIKRKGYEVLLRAFSEIAYRNPDWSLFFAGNPYLRDGINELENGKRLAADLRIADKVKWLGWVSGKEKDKIFNEASIYCLASEGEGFPMGVLDAWAYGLPCVMTPVGGIQDIVKDGINGILFPIGDYDTLAKKLEMLMTNEDLQASIVSKTDQLVYGEFCVDRVNEHLEHIYSSLLPKQDII